MNCDSIHPLLSALLDQELSHEQAAHAEKHLSECAACQGKLEEMRRLDRQLRGVLQIPSIQVKQVVDATLTQTQRLPLLPRRPWRQAAIVLASAAAGFLLALAVPELIGLRLPGATQDKVSTVPAPSDMPVQLALAIGTVEVEENGIWSPLPTGAKLKPGQHIRTLARSRCELRCSDGSEIRLNNESELVIQSPRQLHLNRGQVWSTVAADPVPFQIKTDQATVTAMGTQFDLQYQSQSTILTVLEGKTRWQLADKAVEVKAGQQLRLQNNAGTFDIREPDYALYQATNWVHEILVLKGRDNPELTRRLNDVMANIGETKMIYMAEQEIRTLGDHCVVPLCRFLESPRSKPHADRRQIAARIVSDLAQPRNISDLIDLLTDADPAVRTSVARALLRLTSQDMGMPLQSWQNADAQECKRVQARWKEWWVKNQNRYPVA